MHEGRIVFAQLMEFLPKHEFDKCVARHNGHRRLRRFSCMDQFLCMAYAQLSGCESLRQIETCLRAMKSKLYHAGFRGSVSRSTLADANEARPSQIYADFAQVLIARARALYAGEDLGLALDQAVYALDATTIDLCLALFPWARFRKAKAAVKVHTLLDLRGPIPSVIIVTPGNIHEVNILDELVFEPGAFYLMDRGYLDFERLHRIHRAPAFFVTRPKSNTRWRRLYSRAVDKAAGLRCDQTIALENFYARKDYPDRLRRVGYFDQTSGQRLDFVTNNFDLPALTIARLYQCRWQVELFFKWIKQHLRIKAFYGTSENAVQTQIWIAISVYVLVAIMKKELDLPHSLYTILQILDVTLFEKMPILQAFLNIENTIEQPMSCEQLSLFDF